MNVIAHESNYASSILIEYVINMKKQSPITPNIIKIPKIFIFPIYIIDLIMLIGIKVKNAIAN